MIARRSNAASASPCTPSATSACAMRSTPSPRPSAFDATTTIASASSTPASPRAPQIRDMAALGAIGVVQPGFIDHIGRRGGRGAVRRGDLVAVRRPGPRRHPPGGVFGRSVRFPPAAADRFARDHADSPARAAMLGPEQALAYEEWLRLYTAGAAYAGGQEHERGALTPGKRADLVGPGRCPGRRASPARGADMGGRRARVQRRLTASRRPPAREAEWVKVFC